MKILFVQKMNGISGSELYMLQIMPELKRRGYNMEMLIVYPTYGYNNKRYIEYLAEHGITTHEIYGHNAVSPFLLSKISKLVRKGKYDLVQTNLIHADFWLACIKFLLNRKLKVVSVKHGYHPAYQAKYGFNLRYLKRDPYYWIARFASYMADFNITISKGLYSIYVDGNIVGADRIRNIYYGLTLTSPVHDKAEVNVPVGPYVLITGRLVGFKGHTYLIEAWKKVHKTYPELRLCFAGEGECRKELEQQVKAAGLDDSIIFLGHTPNPHPLMAGSLFTIVSSVWEGFGLILLESWLHKKAIVAFDAPAMNEVVDHEQNGLLAAVKDTNDLADKIIYLCKNPHLSIAYGENGHRKLNSYYTLQRMTDETEEVYKAVAAGLPVPLLSTVK